MTMSILKMAEPGSPSAADRVAAQVAAQVATRAFARFGSHDRVHVEVQNDEQDGSDTLVLPATAIRLLMDVPDHLADGRPVAVVPEAAQLATRRAAPMLDVSRPRPIKLLDAEEVPCQMVGTHRRIVLRDLRPCRLKRTKASATALDELVSRAGESGMGYRLIRYFPEERPRPFGVEPQHPDAFVRHVLDVDPAVALDVVKIATCRTACPHERRPTRHAGPTGPERPPSCDGGAG